MIFKLSGIGPLRFLICCFVILAFYFAVDSSVGTAQRNPAKTQPAKTQPAKTIPAKSGKPDGSSASAPPMWLQWGGPDRNFKVPTQGLNESWPADGPKRLWSRPLGEGHSAILVDGNKLYTMFSNGARETVISLDAATGRTLWEFGYEANTRGMNMGEGRGPHSTPLILGNLIYTVGVKGTMHALDKTSGRMVWKHDLWTEYKGHFEDRGYSPSPVAYKNTVIVPVGGAPGQCLMAFDLQTGSVVWKNIDFTPAPASPIVINLGGQDQIVHFGSNEVYGADATNGNLLWSNPHKTDYGLNISTPVWSPADNLLFISSGYGTGSRAIQLTRNNNQTTAKQAWANNRMRIHFGTAVRIGDTVYGSSGDFGPAFFTAINVKNGQILWQERGLARASFVDANGKFVILDEDGTLAIASPQPDKLNILSKAPVMSKLSWTVPTLAGTKLYLRDRGTIMALDLG